jgi:hypothetical protein
MSTTPPLIPLAQLSDATPYDLELDSDGIADACNLGNSADHVLVGNGKIGLFPSYSNIDLQRCILTCNTESILPKANVFDSFSPCKINIYNGTSTNSQRINLAMNKMTLCMFNGSVTSNFTSDILGLEVTSKLRACKHAPNVMIQTLTIKPPTGVTLSNLSLEHQVYATDGLMLPNYTSRVIDCDDIQSSVYTLTGTAKAVAFQNVEVSFASAYDATVPYEVGGFNTTVDDPRRAYTLLRFRNLNQSVTINIVTVMVTSDEYPDHVRQSVRILLKLLSTQNTITSSIVGLVAAHAAKWSSVWEGNMRIEPKDGITTNERAALKEYWQRHITFALYNIYSSMREGSAVPTIMSSERPDLNAFDIDGMLTSISDLWLTPLLTILQPKLALGLLEYRWQSIAQAMRIANSDGYEGTRYPSVDEDAISMNFKKTLWDQAKPTHIFNTALVAISAWDMFRTRYDRDWLAKKGYEILRHAADFFVSRAYTPVPPETDYSLRDVKGLNDFCSKDQTMTNHLVRIALRAAVEASYELGVNAPQEWEDMYHTLPVAIGEGARQFVVLPDKSDQDKTTDSRFKVLDVLVPISTQYSTLLLEGYISNDAERVVQETLKFYGVTDIADDPATDREKLPFNRLLLAMASGIAAQHGLQIDDNTSISRIDGDISDVTHRYGEGFADRISRMTTSTSGIVLHKRPLLMDPDVVGPVWGNLMSRSKNYDITLGAMLLMTILSGVCGVRVKGGVAETRFYYENMSIYGHEQSFMPKTWKDVRVSAPGQLNRILTTNNRVYS